MARALQYPPSRTLRWLAWSLSLVAAALEAAATRLMAPAAVAPPETEREVGVVEIGGQRYGAIYEGGRLLALVERERL